SIHALSVEGMEKLYMGAPTTTTSASRNSTSASSARAASTSSLPARLPEDRWGRGSRARSRRTTSSSGSCACQRATMAAVSSRLTDWSPVMLESTCSSFKSGVPVLRPVPAREHLSPLRLWNKCGQIGLIVPKKEPIVQDLNDLYYFAVVVDHGGFA